MYLINIKLVKLSIICTKRERERERERKRKREREREGENREREREIMRGNRESFTCAY